jgi:hypothetical protein
MSINIQTDQENTMNTGQAEGLGFYYQWVSLPNPDNEEAISYCREMFGNQGVRWFTKSNKFYFNDEKDAAIFIMKWS